MLVHVCTRINVLRLNTDTHMHILQCTPGATASMENNKEDLEKHDSDWDNLLKGQADAALSLAAATASQTDAFATKPPLPNGGGAVGFVPSYMPNHYTRHNTSPLHPPDSPSSLRRSPPSPPPLRSTSHSISSGKPPSGVTGYRCECVYVNVCVRVRLIVVLWGRMHGCIHVCPHTHVWACFRPHVCVCVQLLAKQ
jgi:hypothetical protein